jgi:hypothetical protein
MSSPVPMPAAAANPIMTLAPTAKLLAVSACACVMEWRTMPDCATV